MRIDAATLDYLTRTLLALPMSYFSARRTGDIQRRLSGLRQVREFMVQSAVAGITSSVQLVAALTLMLVYSPLLAGVFLVTVPLYLGLMRFSSQRLRPIFDDLEEGFGRYASHQIDAIKGIETVKAMGAEVAFRELMLNQFHRIARRQFRADFTIMTYEGAVGMVTFLTSALFLWVGARQVLDGHLTIGALVAFNALVAMANTPMTTILNLWDNFQLVTVLLGRLDDVFQQEPEQGRDRSRLAPVRTLEGRISLRSVGFRYGGPESPAILDGITLDVPAGRMVAIVGRSGCGKTTLVKCLAGLLEPTEGTILYDGVDLHDAQLSRPAPPDRLRPAGEPSLRRLDRPQHRVRRGRARHGPGDVGLARGQRPRVHRAPAARLRHAGRRVGPRRLRRPAPAHRHRPRGLSPAAGAHHGRGDLVARHRVRARGQGEHRPAAAGADLVRHRAPPQHGAGRRPHHGAREGPAGGARQPRRSDEAPGSLLLPRQPAAGSSERRGRRAALPRPRRRRALPGGRPAALGGAGPVGDGHGGVRGGAHRLDRHHPARDHLQPLRAAAGTRSRPDPGLARRRAGGRADHRGAGDHAGCAGVRRFARRRPATARRRCGASRRR